MERIQVLVFLFSTLFLLLNYSCGKDKYEAPKPWVFTSEDSSRFLASITKYDISNVLDDVNESCEKYDPNQDTINRGNSDFDDAQIIFIPEDHTSYKDLLNWYCYMNLFYRDADLVFLFEGFEAGASYKEPFLERLDRIVALRLWYDKLRASDLDMMRNRQNFVVFSTDLSKKFHDEFVSFLGDKNETDENRFIFWDDLSNYSSTYKGLFNRNSSMVRTIKNYIETDKRVVVNSGAFHVPYYDRKFCKSENMTFEDYYDKGPVYSYECTSTVPIYNFIKDKKYAVLEAK